MKHFTYFLFGLVVCECIVLKDLIKKGFSNAIVCVVHKGEGERKRIVHDKCFFFLTFFTVKISFFRDDFKW